MHFSLFDSCCDKFHWQKCLCARRAVSAKSSLREQLGNKAQSSTKLLAVSSSRHSHRIHRGTARACSRRSTQDMFCRCAAKTPSQRKRFLGIGRRTQRTSVAAPPPARQVWPAPAPAPARRRRQCSPTARGEVAAVSRPIRRRRAAKCCRFSFCGSGTAILETQNAARRSPQTFCRGVV